MRLNFLFFALITLFVYQVNAQTTERLRPTEWNNLVFGGRFMDRFLPMPNLGQLTRDTWGAENVLPRYTDNGIENRKWSFWGGNIKLGEDGKYHLYVCGWPESSPKGHNEWPNSTVFNAVSDNSLLAAKQFKVGVLGGVGPAATVDFINKIVRNTSAQRDQDHIKLVVEQNPHISHGEHPGI